MPTLCGCLSLVQAGCDALGVPVLWLAGCYDALSAKVLAEAGHKAAFVSGYAVSVCVWEIGAHYSSSSSRPRGT